MWPILFHRANLAQGPFPPSTELETPEDTCTNVKAGIKTSWRGRSTNGTLLLLLLPRRSINNVRLELPNAVNFILRILLWFLTRFQKENQLHFAIIRPRELLRAQKRRVLAADGGSQ